MGRLLLIRRAAGFFYAIDLTMGIWVMWLYSAIAPRYGATPVAVALAGTAWWVMKTLQSAIGVWLYRSTS